MHELALLGNMMEVALGYASRQGAQRIHRITLQVGEMSGVVPEALEFAFEIVTEDTIAAGAQLELKRMPAVCFCPACAREFRPADVVFACPDCGALDVETRAGRELILESLEVS